ncbi:MAG: TfoX/Sxy family protein [Steroidobacteraceae bacterium]
MTTARNAKVRRRIAAGKLRLRIRDLRNLGPRSEVMLAEVGIHDVATLRRRGGLAAYLALRRAGVTRSLNALWALVGALEPWPEGTDWREVSSGEQRLPLLLAVEQADAEPGRRAAPSAAGAGRRSRRSPGGVPHKRRATRLQDEAWAPGLPFPVPAAAPKTKTPRSRAGRGKNQ